MCRTIILLSLLKRSHVCIMQSGSKTKAAIRKEMADQIEAFKRKGGEVTTVDRGISGYESNMPPLHDTFHFIPASHKSRTDLSPLIKIIDSRRNPKKTVPIKPKKVLIVDDFGDPLRWVWSDHALAKIT